MAQAVVNTYKIDGTPVGTETPFGTPAAFSTEGVDVVKLRLNQSQLQGSAREGNDLILYAGADEASDKIVIQDFFAKDVKLVLEDETTNQLALASYDAANFNGLTFTPIESLDEVFAGTVDEIGGWVLPLVGVVGLGGIIAAVASDDDKDNGVAPVDPIDPIDPIDPVDPQPVTVWDVFKEFVDNKLEIFKDYITAITELPSVKAVLNILNFAKSFIVGAWETGIAFVKAIASPFVEAAKTIWEVIKLTGDLAVNLFDGFFDVVESIFTGQYKPLSFVMMIFDVFGTYLKDLVGIGVNALNNITGAWKNLFDVGSGHFENVKDAYGKINWLDLLQAPFDFVKAIGLTFKSGIEQAGNFFTFIKDAAAALFDGGLGFNKFVGESVETGKGWFGALKDIVGILFGKSPATPVEEADKDTTQDTTEDAATATTLSATEEQPSGSFFSKIVDGVKGIFSGEGFIGGIISTVKSFVGGIVDFIKGIIGIGETEDAVDAASLVSEETTVDALLPASEDSQISEPAPTLVASSSEEALRALVA